MVATHARPVHTCTQLENLLLSGGPMHERVAKLADFGYGGGGGPCLTATTLMPAHRGHTHASFTRPRNTAAPPFHVSRLHKRARLNAATGVLTTPMPKSSAQAAASDYEKYVCRRECAARSMLATAVAPPPAAPARRPAPGLTTAATSSTPTRACTAAAACTGPASSTPRCTARAPRARRCPRPPPRPRRMRGPHWMRHRPSCECHGKVVACGRCCHVPASTCGLVTQRKVVSL